VRYTVVLLTLILFVGLFFSVPGGRHGEATAAHGCAPRNPPAVAGALPPPSSAHEVLLNEVLTFPQSAWNCASEGAPVSLRDAWVELYNPQNRPFDLYAVHASLDTGPQTTPFFLPLGSAIPAHGFLVLFPEDGEVSSTAFFPQGACTVRLLFNGTAVIDQVTIPQLGADQSFARTIDGGPQWQSTTAPTIAASNGALLQSTPAATGATTPPAQGEHHRSTGQPPDKQPAPPSGTQPVWQGLHFPAGSSPTPISSVSTAQPASVPPPPPAATSSDTLRLLLSGGLVLALLGLLFWGWRLFKPPHH
jgi:hypothetical protein